jgi:Zc3h12a-like Ribonuclease NYN domain
MKDELDDSDRLAKRELSLSIPTPFFHCHLIHLLCLALFWFLLVQAYGEWLKLQHEFKYIIDGANVAYNHQNFEEGKFSYRQIELVVDRVLARGDGKVLVLLPYSYAQKIVPNSSKQRGKRNISYVSQADQVNSRSRVVSCVSGN